MNPCFMFHVSTMMKAIERERENEKNEGKKHPFMAQNRKLKDETRIEIRLYYSLK